MEQLAEQLAVGTRHVSTRTEREAQVTLKQPFQRRCAVPFSGQISEGSPDTLPKPMTFVTCKGHSEA
jgi:hypothetical protein